MKNFLALFFARNREFYRDKGSLSWSLLFPLILIFGLSFALSNDKYVYKVGILTPAHEAPVLTALKDIPYLETVPYADPHTALKRLAQHQLDLVISTGTPTEYWVNEASKKAWFLEAALHGHESNGELRRHIVNGEEVGYVAWVVPGVLSMSLMFSCLYGVGYQIVRYRDLGVLKRYKATPVGAFEFLSAQMASRLLITFCTLAIVFAGSHSLLDYPMHGSYLLLGLVAVLGALSMIALSLLCAARIDSLEFMNGLLNLISWPMMLLSGLWFSLDNAPAVVRDISTCLPLSHVVSAARAIMLEGAGLREVAPHLLTLAAMTALLLALAARLFRWQKD